MTEALTLDAVSKRSGISVRRLREWCATGRLKADKFHGTWLLPRSELPRVAELAAERIDPARITAPLALLVPADVAPRNLATQIANRLGLAASSIALRGLAIDGQAYVVAVGKDGSELGDQPALAELADEIGGQLLDGLASAKGR